MKKRIKTILFLVVTVYIIPGTVMFFLDSKMLMFYLLVISPAIIPYYLWAPDKKRSCKFLGIEFKFWVYAQGLPRIGRRRSRINKLNQYGHPRSFNCSVLSFVRIFFCPSGYFLSTFCLETKGGAPARTYQRKILNCVMVRYGRAKFKPISMRYISSADHS